MKKTYKITAEKRAEAFALIKQNGGKIYTDRTFEISGVEGVYKEDGENVTIIITDKPWLASWDMIEEKLDEFFN